MSGVQVPLSAPFLVGGIINSQHSEYEWILSILGDLRRNYTPEHNEKVLDQLIEIVRYRIECLEK